MNTLTPPQHLAAPGQQDKQMEANAPSTWNPTLCENMPAEEETGFLLVLFAVDNKCDFSWLKIN